MCSSSGDRYRRGGDFGGQGGGGEGTAGGRGGQAAGTAAGRPIEGDLSGRGPAET